MSNMMASITNNANTLSACLLSEDQAISAGIQPAYCNLSSGAQDMELSGHNGMLRLSINKTLNVFNTTMQTGTQMPNIYWPWVICTTGRIANPLGKYYMYYSGDHIYETGWISMAYSDDLLSGWTDYGQVFRNYSNLTAQTTPKETETPSVIWNETNREFIMYFHSTGTYTGEAQTSWYLTSTDGVNWAERTKMLDIDVTRVPGNAHNGYPHPFEYYGTLFAYTLMGGGNGGTALSYSEDGGYHWTTMHKLLGRWCLTVDGYSLYAHHGSIVNMQGMDYWVGIMQNFASGTQPKIARIVAVPMVDLARPFGKPVVLFTPTDATYEGDNLRSFSIYQEGNKLYLFYHSCVGTSNYFNVAVMEATTAAPVAATIAFTVRPANASVTAGVITGSLAALAVASDGSAISYQWYSNTRASNTGGTLISGATGNSFTIPTSLTEGTYYYYCVATSATAGSVTSSVATITVASAPVAPTVAFTVQPANASVTAGSITGSLSVLATASDASVVSYQWYSNTSAGNTGGSLISGATSASYAIPTSLNAGSYYYYCVATSATAGSTTSNVVAVTVVAQPTISFTTQPANASVTAGSISGSLSVLATASDSSAISYQWYSNTSASNTGGSLIPDATSASYAIPTSLTAGSYYYYCVATSATAGSATSIVAMVTVAATSTTPTVSFTAQPTSISVYVGSVIGLLQAVAAASDSSAVSYQWYANTTASNTGGTLVSGATNGIFSVPTDIAQTTCFYCVATSETAGSAASNVATVTVKTLTDLASYTLTGTPGAAAPATIEDTTGNGNTLTVNGITEYGISGGLPGGAANQSLYLPSLNLNGHTSYVMFMEFYNMNGVSGQHRMFECVTDALGMQISSNLCNGKMRWETTGSAFTSPTDSPSVILVGGRTVWVIERLVVEVNGDVLTATMQVRDDAHVEMISMTFTATGFTSAFTSGVYFLNRADGTRPFPGALREFRVGYEGGAA